MGILLALCGLTVVGIGVWRGYAAVREALGPLVHDGEPTRTAIEAAQPVYLRPRVRLFARRVGLSVGWLAVALYGLFLVSSGLDTP